MQVALSVELRQEIWTYKISYLADSQQYSSNLIFVTETIYEVSKVRVVDYALSFGSIQIATLIVSKNKENLMLFLDKHSIKMQRDIMKLDNLMLQDRSKYVFDNIRIIHYQDFFFVVVHSEYSNWANLYAFDMSNASMVFLKTIRASQLVPFKKIDCIVTNGLFKCALLTTGVKFEI